MRKKISTTIYVTPEQADKLKLLHERTKVPVAVYIREGIDLVLRHYAHMLPGQLALVPESADDSFGSSSGLVTPRPPDVSQVSAVSADAEMARRASDASGPPPSAAAAGGKK